MRATQKLLLVLTLIAGAAAPAAAPAQGSNAAAEYERALRAFEDGDVTTSVAALKRALQQDPALLAGHVLVARLYLRIGEAAAAESALQRARRLGADPNLIWPLRAEAMARQGKFDELLAISPREGLEPEPQSKVLVTRGKALIEQSKYEEAEASFAAATALTPGTADPLVGLATVALRQGDGYSAEARAIRATRVAPDAAGAWAVFGDVRHAQGKLPQALDAYARALEIDPDLVDARLARAGILLDSGDLDAAEADVRSVRERFPLEPRAAFLEAQALAKRGRPEQALDALRRALALLQELGAEAVDRNSQLLLLAGMSSYELGELERAQGYLARFVERHPDQPGPRKLLGSILLRNGRSAEAIVVLEPALAQAPGDYRLLTLMGAAYSQRGRHDLAGPYLEKAVKLGDGAPDLRARRALNRVAAGFENEGIQELEELFAADPQSQTGVGIALLTVRMRRGEFEAARQVGEQLVRTQPDNVMVLNLLGTAQLRSGRADEARESFEMAMSLQEGFLPARINMGAVEAGAGQFELAKKMLLEALEIRADSVPAMISLAKLSRQMGQADEALRWLQKAQGADPRSVSAALALVDLYLDGGSVLDAQRIALEAESWEPENLRVLAALARTYVAQDRVDLAVEVYKRMSRIAGFDAAELLRIARLQAAAGRTGDAIFTLQKGLKGDAGDSAVREMLVALELREGRMAQAAENVAVLLEETPGRPAVQRLAGELSMAANRPQEAAEHFRRALELQPTTGHVLALHGALLTAGQEDEAVALLETWVEGHPDDVAARLALGDRHLLTGAYPRARRQYEAVLEKDPFQINALNNLAFLLDETGESGALTYAERALKRSPNDPAVLDTLGWLLVRNGNPTRGLSLLRDAHARAASNPEIRYHIAEALAALGRKDEARMEVVHALSIAQEFHGADEARALLERLQP